jgi:putative membrane protein
MTTAPDSARDEVTLRESVPPVREWARTFVVGLFMGTADAVPGVSGGTIALIAGVYERLITAINEVTPGRFLDGVVALTPLDGGVSLDRAAAVLEEVDGWFLVALLAGILSAVILVTRIVDVANEAAPVLLFGFFFGLIGASAVILFRAVTVRTLPEVVAAVAGFAVAFVVSGYGEVLASGGLPVVFGAGALAVSAMILPGISGSLVLVILSQYERMSSTLSAFVDALVGVVTGGGVAPVVDRGVVVVTFVCGGLVGLFTVSRVIRRALDYNREVTFAFLVALVLGALRAPIVTLNGEEYAVVWNTPTIQAFAGAAVVGALVVFALDWYAVDLDLDSV